ncbi:MAG TPA: CerR family C-terminal domain-containing protein [Bryobacteraceae bacterium]|nr:CerR family C-terminal domain-containing protein [Bryobacteraceae bacterium]
MDTGKQVLQPLKYSDATRAKVLETAGIIFAEHGFQGATVREICARAGANVAAVNYYFGDKLALYTEALRASICAAHGEAMRQALEKSKTPEDALRRFIEAMFQRMFGGDRSGWNIRIMAHEIASPTPALPRVIDEVMRPNYEKVREIIGQILGLPPDDDTTRLCAHSLIGQVVHYVIAGPVIHLLWPDLKLTPERLQQISTHIADFTLCSLHALAKRIKQKHTGKEPQPHVGRNSRVLRAIRPARVP